MDTWLRNRSMLWYQVDNYLRFLRFWCISLLFLHALSLLRRLHPSSFRNLISITPATLPLTFTCKGTVPVYLGDAAHLKALLPHPKAAIFIADYNGNYAQLAKYLTYLSNNETAYESHREWRRNFTYESNIKDKPLLQTSWYCNVCRWAADNAEDSQFIHNRQKRTKICHEKSKKTNLPWFKLQLL